MNERCKGRLLIVDDDPRFRAELAETFRPRGFIVRAPEGKGHELREAARRTAREFRPHVTIMDLRLLEGQTPPDLSGESLLDEPDFAFTRCVVYSTYLVNDYILARKLMKKPNVDDVVGRLEVERLEEAVQKAFRNGCACSQDYHVSWPVAWKPASIAEALFGKDSGVPDDIIIDALGRLFPDGARLRLGTLEGAATTTSVARGHSVLLHATIPNKVPFVIKLAPSKRVREEVAAYKKYIDQTLGGHFHVHLRNSCVFWDVGAIHYSLLGSSQHPTTTLAAFYQGAQDSEQVVRPLRHFFEQVWSTHYTGSRTELEGSLFDAYDRALNLRERLGELRGDEVASAFPGAPRELPDPRKWAIDHAPDSGTFPAQQAVTHGDLHGDNMFVEGDHAWALDFERSGPGPILRDFVELEQDIVTRLMPLGGDDFDAFFRFALALTTPRSVNEPLRVPKLTPEMEKAAAVIAGLREIAVGVTKFKDMREYYWGLLLDALLGSSLVEKDSPQRKRSMLLAAVISSRLEKWNAQWPPDWARRRLEIVPTPSPDAPRRRDVFVSYNGKDVGDVTVLVNHLRAEGLNVWYDRDLSPGDSWFDVLEERLTRSRACIICYGPSGLSDWQRHERNLAIDYSIRKKLRAIPVKLPGCKDTEADMGLAGLSQLCDFSAGLDNEEEFRKLLDGVKG